jgi:transcriptional regulator with XRE-family HTH domain
MRIRWENSRTTIVYLAMGRRVKVAETKEEAKAETDLVKELTGAIIARAVKNGWTREELARRAKKKSASTLYGWRNGTRKNPSLLDLRAFAQAVGLDVRLIDESLASGKDGTIFPLPEGATVTSYTRRLVAIMEQLPEQAQHDLLETAISYQKVWGGSHPDEPTAEHNEASRGRRSKS